MEDDGVITLASEYPVRETVDRFASIAESRGMTVFARIDHAANAAQVGMELRPTELLVFGNPTVGTTLMQDKQTAGLDLPVKVLVWEDADSRVWLSYDSVAWIAKRHGLGTRSDASVKAIELVLATVSNAAATR